MALNYLLYPFYSVIILAVLSVLFYYFWFLRKPDRNIPSGSNIVSPANGRISSIVDVNGKDIGISKGLFGRIKTLTRDTVKEGYLITIVMTPFSVHYQRAPCDGTVESISYKKGKLLNAVAGAGNMRATLENEKNEIIMKTRYGKIKVIQIAGFVARRIRCFVRKNQNIKKGEIIGIIKLGSQVCLIMPKIHGMKLKVKKGENVVDGETIIAG